MTRRDEVRAGSDEVVRLNTRVAKVHSTATSNRAAEQLRFTPFLAQRASYRLRQHPFLVSRRAKSDRHRLSSQLGEQEPIYLGLGRALGSDFVVAGNPISAM